jgi:hypothetical protein
MHRVALAREGVGHGVYVGSDTAVIVPGTRGVLWIDKNYIQRKPFGWDHLSGDRVEFKYTPPERVYSIQKWSAPGAVRVRR